MQLDRYLDWIANTLDSRRDAELEHFWVEYIEPGRQALVEGRLRFWDGSLLKFIEVLQQRGAVIGKLEYAYHYQDRQDTLIFRYDNAPHHPSVATFPHHKHVMTPKQQEESIAPATPPHFSEVLRDIEIPERRRRPVVHDPRSISGEIVHPIVPMVYLAKKPCVKAVRYAANHDT